MIKHPPFNNISAERAAKLAWQEIEEEKFLSYMFAFQKPVDDKGRYLHFDEFRYRVPPELNPDWAWAIMRNVREKQSVLLFQPNNILFQLYGSLANSQYMQTPAIQRTLSMVDRHTSESALNTMANKVGEQSALNRYLNSDLAEDEAISSSQLEGAATTTLVAKDMLRRKRKPRTPDEKMILGNYRMMQFVWERRHQELSLELITDLHRIGTEGVDDAAYTPGQLRYTDDVVVVRDDEVVHQPPPAEKLAQRLKTLIDWVNHDHDVDDASVYLHPLIKAITLHFAIGYEHPFRDGNGRVARGLFYWYMFKNDYTAFRYIAISKLLKKAPVQYGKSYLYTETDRMDMTYFIDYQCRIIVRAIRAFLDAYQKIRRDIADFDRWLWDSGLYGKLNEKQRMLFNIAKDDAKRQFTVREVEHNLGCSYNTAAAVLNGLVKLGLFNKHKSGREWVYALVDKELLQKDWRG